MAKMVQPNVHVVDHPLVQHKLTVIRDKETSTAKFRMLVHEIAQLICYEVTRDLPTEMVEVETPLTKAKISQDCRQEAGFCADPAGGPVPARRNAGAGALRPCCPYRPLPRPRDAAAGRILLQGPERSRRPPDHRG